MELPKQFESIRPYADHEVKQAVERLVTNERFHGLLDFLYDGVHLNELFEKLRSLETVDQFQRFFSLHTVRKIIEMTSLGLTDQGAENLFPGKPHLFIANHRDIVLDAAIMQYLLHQHGHRTSQITFSVNLMSEQLLLDLGKLNRMFTFFRGGSRIEQYKNALINSAYINHVIREQDESVWIAQRNGRTKDGNDRTQSGLIKMLSVGSDRICDALAGLNLVPVTISYEIEPCDILKVRELYLSRRETYVKSPNEDYGSILTGITGEKGRIHYAFGMPLNSFIESLSCSELADNDIVERIAAEIDRQIHRDFHLWPGNFIAYDLLIDRPAFEDRYSGQEMKAFVESMDRKIASLAGFDQSELRNMYLEMYANPVRNKLSIGCL